MSDAKEKLKALQLTLDKLDKTYGKGTVMKLSDEKVMDVPAISTGSLGLDIALGIGGIPRGRVTEIYGPESSGKTTLTMHCIAEAQKKGGLAAFIDAEHAYVLSNACSASIKAAKPPFFCASAIQCMVRVVLPDDSGP